MTFSQIIFTYLFCFCKTLYFLYICCVLNVLRHSVVSDTCNPIDCSLPGSSVHGILQARILDWVAIYFSRGSSWPRVQIHISCIDNRFFITKPPEKPDTQQCIPHSLDTMEYYSTITRNDILMYATTWVNPIIAILRERSQAKRIAKVMIPFT